MLALGCATGPPADQDREWEFFAPASPKADAWYPKVAEWQTRARAEQVEPLVQLSEEEAEAALLSRLELRSSQANLDDPSADPDALPADLDPLPNQLGAFASTQRLLLAQRIFHWTIKTTPFYYQKDGRQSDEPASQEPTEDERLVEAVADDYWPTYSELVERNGDDCDGLDLVAYRMLQEFGFPQDQLFRGVIRRDRDRANHMVTLWFEDPSDPWVFDATGAATNKFVRFSEVSGWTPTAVFNESDQYTVRLRHTQLGRAAQARGAALD
jgi:hypothetical protein